MSSLPKLITKRNGTVMEFQVDKITRAIEKSGIQTGEFDISEAERLTEDVIKLIKEHNNYDQLTVENIQDLVEVVLLESDYKTTAKAYIIYREKRNQARRPDIFKHRLNLKPYEYPELAEYKEAIQHSYWLHTEFNYTSDVQDFKVNVSDAERNAIKNAMLAIAQVEVAVKTFWGDLYHRMPKPELGSVGYTFAESECHREGTEILTPKGWVDFRDINNGDTVAQYNHDNTLSFVPVRNKISRWYEGKLHHLTKDYMDVWITPNHNMCIYKSKEAKKFELIPSSELSGRNSNFFIPQAAKLNGKVVKLTDLERLYIAIQADGSYRTWKDKNGNVVDRGLKTNEQTYEISFKKKRKIERFLELASKIDGLEVSEHNISRKEYRKFSLNLDRNFNYKTFDWVDLSDKSWEWCEEFIQELAEWDGCRLSDKKDGKISYSTTDGEIANIVQAIGAAAGYRVTVGLHPDNRNPNNSSCYKMVFVGNRKRVTGTYSKEEVDYSGNVYCVEVDSGAIVTRYNGKMFIGGNCRHEAAYSHLLEILGLNDDFEKIKEIPQLMQRVDYLTKGVALAKTGSDKDYTLSLLLFSLFIEHVSLFSQFLIIMSFNKYKNIFKGMSNVIEATSKEEQIHGLFGIELINVIRKEHPEWFDDHMEYLITKACREAYESEQIVIDWIYKKGDLDFLPKATVKEFVKNRLNNSLKSVGYNPIFEVDEQLVEETDWFNDEVVATKHVDFFVKRSINYSKRTRSITGDDLF